MNIRKIDGPRIVRGQNGQIICHNDLPAPDTRRWVASRKSVVVDAVNGGLISRRDALERYNISAEEYAGWEHAVATRGVRGLKSKAQKGLASRSPALLTAKMDRRVHVGDLTLDPADGTATLGGVDLELRGIEHQVLSRLALEAGVVVTRAALLQHLYGDEEGAEIRILNVVVCLLRSKLRRDGTDGPWIETVWGRGYVLHASAAKSGKKAELHD